MTCLLCVVTVSPVEAVTFDFAEGTALTALATSDPPKYTAITGGYAAAGGIFFEFSARSNHCKTGNGI